MKLQILSDLHLEFGPFKMPEIERDLLIIAGDTDIGTRAKEFLISESKKSPVIMVLGNHEFYNFDFDQIKNEWQKMNLVNLFYLDNKEVIIHGVRFLGCTLWTNMDKENPIAIKNVQDGLADYHVIRKGKRLLLPNDTVSDFHQSVRFLREALNRPFSGPTVVVTHHMPSYKSVAHQFLGNPYNPGFASNLDELILTTHPNLWIHGHTHVSFDYFLGNTRILCNPRGYVNREENPIFLPTLTIEI